MIQLYKKRSIALFSICVFFLLACDATFAMGYPTSTSTVPIPTEALPVTSGPLLSQQVSLNAVPFIETDPGENFPTYTITAQIPQLNGSSDERVQAFNQRLDGLIKQEIEAYRQNFRQLPITPNSNGSSLAVTYTLVSQIGELWSFKFDFSFYSDGAAHPGMNSITLNYDLGQDKELILGDLFLVNSNYLQKISEYCIIELRKQPFADVFTETGAEPTPENYRNWNITPDGLLITFDAYQVAPGAAGPQQVLVPYGELSSLLNPQGPLSVVLK
jgi:hypothetical protein